MVQTIKIKTPQERKIEELEKENKMLKARNDALDEQVFFHQEVLTEVIIKIYQ